MAFLDLVKQRRSVRRYQPRPVPREAIERCLEAARWAPSACNSQPWHFIVVDREPLRTQVAEAACSGVYSIFRFIREAPVLVVVVTERSRYIARLAGQLRGVQYALIDIGIACEHLVLQAAEEGLGSCWVGWFNERAVKNVLGLPRAARVDVLITLGYPADDPPAQRQRRPLDEIREYRPAEG